MITQVFCCCFFKLHSCKTSLSASERPAYQSGFFFSPFSLYLSLSTNQLLPSLATALLHLGSWHSLLLSPCKPPDPEFIRLAPVSPRFTCAGLHNAFSLSLFSFLCSEMILCVTVCVYVFKSRLFMTESSSYKSEPRLNQKAKKSWRTYRRSIFESREMHSLAYKIHDFHQAKLSCNSDEEERGGMKKGKGGRRRRWREGGWFLGETWSSAGAPLSKQYAGSSAPVKQTINQTS